MGIVIKNTNYNGEVLEKMLMRATTGNQLFERGLICLHEGVHTKKSIPRLRAGKMLQKRKPNPTLEDAKGDFNYDERFLEPKDFMVFAKFNPRDFEAIWRKWQPKGMLVFSELPPEGQNALLEALSGNVDFELGGHYINGRLGDGNDDLFNGFVVRMLSDRDTVTVPSGATTQIKRLTDLRAAIPDTMLNNPKLRILMSAVEFQEYDDELTKQTAKGVNYTDISPRRFKSIPIEDLALWPRGLTVATIVGMDETKSNLHVAVNLQDDSEVIQIERYAPASEFFFFKMLMKADTNTAFGEEVVILDTRVAETATRSGTVLTMKTDHAKYDYTPTESSDLSIRGAGVLLGARLALTNKATSVDCTVEGVKVAAKATVTLAYDGKAWFNVADPYPEVAEEPEPETGENEG